MRFTSDGNVSGEASGLITVAVLVFGMLLSAIGGAVASYFAFSASNRQSDIEAAKLALTILETQPSGIDGAVPRKFAVDLLQRSTGIDLSLDEYNAWINGDVVLASSAISAFLINEGRLMLPKSLLEDCPPAVVLSEDALISGLPSADVEVLWGRDRSALRVCTEKHRILAKYFTAGSQ